MKTTMLLPLSEHQGSFSKVRNNVEIPLCTKPNQSKLDRKEIGMFPCVITVLFSVHKVMK